MEFMGKTVAVNSNAGIFVTMNPAGKVGGKRSARPIERARVAAALARAAAAAVIPMPCTAAPCCRSAALLVLHATALLSMLKIPPHTCFNVPTRALPHILGAHRAMAAAPSCRTT